MNSRIDRTRRARLLALVPALVPALVAAALAMPLPVGAVAGHALETFSDGARLGLEPAYLVETGNVAWVLRSGEDAPVFADSAGRIALDATETFAHEHGDHQSRDGGGWVEHGALGEDGGHHCDDGCVGTSAVPEPKRTALTVMGLLAVVLLVKRQGRMRRAVIAA